MTTRRWPLQEGDDCVYRFTIEDVDIYTTTEHGPNGWYRLQTRLIHNVVPIEQIKRNAEAMTVEAPFWQTLFSAIMIAGLGQRSAIADNDINKLLERGIDHEDSIGGRHRRD